MAGRTFLASWQLSATRSHTCAMWARVTRAPWSPNVRAISKHCCARRRYSSALLATIPLPVRPLDDKRGQRRSVSIQDSGRQPHGRRFATIFATQLGSTGRNWGVQRRAYECVLSPKTLTKRHAVELGGMAEAEYHDRFPPSAQGFDGNRIAWHAFISAA